MQKKATKTEQAVKLSPKTISNFPKLLMLFGLLLVIAGAADFFKFYIIPRLAMQILMFFSGLWMIKLGIEKGFYKKHKELFKKYI